MYNRFMTEALKQAKLAYEKCEIPVGAVVTLDNEIISSAHNMRETNNLATAHAEVLAIESACKKLKSWRLTECSIYVTLEPCPMCMGAIINARIKKLFFGAPDKKTGACGSVLDLTAYQLNHKITIYEGIMEEECSNLLSTFFSNLRI